MFLRIEIPLYPPGESRIYIRIGRAQYTLGTRRYLFRTHRRGEFPPEARVAVRRWHLRGGLSNSWSERYNRSRALRTRSFAGVERERERGRERERERECAREKPRRCLQPPRLKTCPRIVHETGKGRGATSCSSKLLQTLHTKFFNPRSHRKRVSN